MHVSPSSPSQKAIIRGSLHPSPLFNLHPPPDIFLHSFHLFFFQSARNILFQCSFIPFFTFRTNLVKAHSSPCCGFLLSLRHEPTDGVARNQCFPTIESSGMSKLLLYIARLFRFANGRRTSLQFCQVHIFHNGVQCG